MLKINKIWLFCLIGLIVTACSISYKFNGASIDYTKVKTITIKDFPNQAPLVYAPFAKVYGSIEGYLYPSDPSAVGGEQRRLGPGG